jgi:hypothetical protein
MITNKQTQKRVNDLVHHTKHTLQAFQIGRFIKQPDEVVIDLPIFAIRFKFLVKPLQDDHLWTVLQINEEPDIDSDELFVLLCQKGYLHWLRHKLTNSNSLFLILGRQNRWELLVDRAIQNAKENKRGEYLIDYLEQMKRKPLLQVYHEDPFCFDWIMFL